MGNGVAHLSQMLCIFQIVVLFFVQAVYLLHAPSCKQIAMICNVCGLSDPSNFRCRDIGKPFNWWCDTCYHVQFAGKTKCHDIEHPIICHECNVLPASLRSQSQAVAAPTTHWTYWCYYCYERQPHGDLPHKLHDLDSDSDSDESDQEEDHASIRSFSTWQKEDCALSCTSWPKDDDATSNATSNASFKLSWERVEVEDDSMSHSSFQMVGGNTSNADDAGFGSAMGIGDNTSNADDAELEEQQQQEQQQQQQQQHIQSPTEQQLQQQQQQQHKPQADLGAWLVAWELDLAIAMSLRDASGFDKATSSSSSISSSSSSSSSNSSAAAIVAAPVLQKNKKEPNNIVNATLDTIDEQPSQYVGLDGCMHTMFTAEWNASDVVCPHHGSEWEPHCRHCANHQFMVHKHRHEVNEAIAIQRSMHNTSVIWVERGGQLWATCSNHPNNNKQEDCSACTMVVQLLATGHGVKAM